MGAGATLWAVVALVVVAVIVASLGVAWWEARRARRAEAVRDELSEQLLQARSQLAARRRSDDAALRYLDTEVLGAPPRSRT